MQGEYRAAMAKEWLECFKELDVPHTQEPNLIATLGDPVKIRSWQVRVVPLLHEHQPALLAHSHQCVGPTAVPFSHKSLFSH